MRVCPWIVAVVVAMTGCSHFLSESPDPEDGETLTFNSDVVDVADSWVYSASPDESRGADEKIVWNVAYGGGGHQRDSELAVALLRFDVIGEGAEQIAAGAEIASATLFLTVGDNGNTGTLCDSLVPWDEATTWNSLGASPGLDDDDYDPAPLGALSATSAGEVLEVDVTSSVSAWVSGARENLGWMIVPSGSNGTEVYSSETSIESSRPELVVELRRR